MRVLVVDDSEAAAKTLGWAAEAWGYEVRLAHDGPTAVETARTYRPHVMLLDITLPGMSGYEVCRLLRQDTALQNTVFVAQTGWGHEHHKEAKEAGFQHHLLKPVDMNILEGLLAAVAEKVEAAA